jgi:hypothetical protein
MRIIPEDSLIFPYGFLKAPLFPIDTPEIIMRSIGNRARWTEPDRGLIFPRCLLIAFSVVVIEPKLIVGPGLSRAFLYHILP